MAVRLHPYEMEIKKTDGTEIINAVGLAADALGWERDTSNVYSTVIRRIASKPRFVRKYEHTKIVMTKEEAGDLGIKIPVEVIRVEIRKDELTDKIMLRANGDTARIYDIGAFAKTLYDILYSKTAQLQKESVDQW